MMCKDLAVAEVVHGRAASVDGEHVIGLDVTFPGAERGRAADADAVLEHEDVAVVVDVQRVVEFGEVLVGVGVVVQADHVAWGWCGGDRE